MSNAAVIDKMIAIAKAEVGYREGKNNWNKYAPAVPGLEWAQNQPYCATGISWVAVKAGLENYYPITAYVPTIVSRAKAMHQWSDYPAVGAWVVVGNQAHCGLVVDFDSVYITTVEFNTNDNGSANGDGVYLRRRVRRSASVLGYFYPKIPGVALRSADPDYKPPAKEYVTKDGDLIVRGSTPVANLVAGQKVKVK